MAHPAIPPKKPEVIFPHPKAIHSLLPLPLVPLISSKTAKVKSDSISPTRAIMMAYGRTMTIASRLKIVSGSIK